MAEDRLAFSSFGVDPDGWNIDTSNQPGIRLFSNAVQVYAICNPGCTAGQAAEVFNVDLGLLIEAVEYHPWMFLDEDLVIEHEGE